MKSITAVIITQDEERNIGRCLASVEGVADEVVVVDSGSSDGTEDLCRAAGARFVSHAWEGYAAQKNFANSLASGSWILSLDADEALSPTLRESLLRWKAAPGGDEAVSFNRLTHYCGRAVRHCGWYPDSKVRLWPAGAAAWDGSVHETLRYARPLPQRHLDGDLLHYSYTSVADHAARQVRYAALAAEKARARGKRCSALGLRLRPAWAFLHAYIVKGGFLDGRTGYTVCRMTAFYTFLKYAMLRNPGSTNTPNSHA